MWRATSIDLKKARPNPASPLLSPTFAVAAVGLVAADCSTQNVSGPRPAQPLRPASSPPATSTAHLPQVRCTSSMAAFRLPAAVSRPTVFAGGKGLLVVPGMTASDTTTKTILQVALAQWTVNPAGQMPVPLRKAASRPLGACPLPDPTLVAVVAGADYAVGRVDPKPVDTVIPGRAQTGGTP